MKKTNIWNCIGTAFATYSRIPVPHGTWDPDSLKWQICFFPLVGLVIGVLWGLAAAVLTVAAFSPMLTGACLTALPIILTGGIHMDGYLDTSDAIHSWKPAEERLKILKDPHIGAFAWIYGAVYLLMQYGLCVQLAENLQASGQCYGRRTVFAMLFSVCLGFVLSRTLSAIALLGFPKARRDGMLRTTADATDESARTVLYAELAFVLAVELGAAILFRRPEPILIPAAAGGILFYYHRTAMRLFGGTTGDLAGWFLQLCELGALAVTVICGKFI